MSHITDARLRVRELDAVEEAADRCGLTLVRGQKTHAWYGRFVGDSNAANGRDPRTFGKCDHALRLKDHQRGDYEIGLVAAAGEDGFDAVFDSWGPGKRLEATAGPNLNRFRQEYAAAVLTARARKKLAPKGFTTTREELSGGRIRLRLRRR